MKTLYIVNLKNDNELIELKFLLFTREYESNAFRYTLPIIVDKENKTFDNITNDDLLRLKKNSSKTTLLETDLEGFKSLIKQGVLKQETDFTF